MTVQQERNFPTTLPSLTSDLIPVVPNLGYDNFSTSRGTVPRETDRLW